MPVARQSHRVICGGRDLHAVAQDESRLDAPVPSAAAELAPDVVAPRDDFPVRPHRDGMTRAERDLAGVGLGGGRDGQEQEGEKSDGGRESHPVRISADGAAA
jgi:hypothetical protein